VEGNPVSVSVHIMKKTPTSLLLILLMPILGWTLYPLTASAALPINVPKGVAARNMLGMERNPLSVSVHI
jgi:hypothetical protein